MLVTLYILFSAPSPPNNFMAVPLSPFAVELTWEEPTDLGGITTTILVVHGSNSLPLGEGAIIQEYIITFDTSPPTVERLSGDARSYTADIFQPETNFE